jgi:hypothetical protein
MRSILFTFQMVIKQDNMKTDIEVIRGICDRISMKLFGNSHFYLRICRDLQDPREEGRIFLQILYEAPCSKTQEDQIWRGRKFYLSDYMTEDEIIKSVYLAFKLAVEHEIMEGFTVDGKILFNPHVNYESLLTISDNEVKRK